MTKEEILSQVNIIFCDVLDNDDIRITGETSAADIEEWDSLSHIQLIVAIEKQFKMKFTAAEIHNWKNVDEMIKSIHQRQNG